MVYTNPEEVVDFSTDNEYWINRLIEDAKKHPDEIQIISLPQKDGDVIHVKVPNKYLGVRPEQIQIW